MKRNNISNINAYHTINRFPTSGSNLSSNLILNPSEEKAYQELSEKIKVQNRILKEYKLWTNTLVNIISEHEMKNEHLDLGTPIQKRLEYIQNLTNENLEIKKKIIQQIELNSKLEDKIKIKKWNLNNCVKDYNSKEVYSDTNNILEKNVQTMANELDNLLELKMEMDLVIGNKDANLLEDVISNNTMIFNAHQKTKSNDSTFSNKVIQSGGNLDILKIKELYYIKKNLIEENEMLMKIKDMFISDAIKRKNKTFCGCKTMSEKEEEGKG
jgi:hypothetical protein